jgi:hypothetical protein
MMPPMPGSGESANERFKRFAGAILAVPKTEVPTAGTAIARLRTQRQKIEDQLKAVQQEISKRKT